MNLQGKQFRDENIEWEDDGSKNAKLNKVNDFYQQL